MPLEYNLLSKKNGLTKKNIEISLLKLKWQFKQEYKTENCSYFILDDKIGFTLILLESKREVEFGMNNIFTYDFSISFIINRNDIEPKTYKSNILLFLLQFREIMGEPMLLLFNGEIVILKDNGKEREFVINKIDFWDDTLKHLLEGIVDYSENSFCVL